MTELNVWVGSCSHVHTDLERGNRESYAAAIRQSEGHGPLGAPAFDWDIMLHLGDLSGSQTPPDDAEAEEVFRQWSAMRDHRREQIYNVLGNHDASGPDEPTQWWFKQWIDPTGEHPAHSGVDNDERPFPVTGTWERYSFQAGNVLFLMMGDRNDGGPPSGRAYSETGGGYPAGKVTRETFEWWREMVETNQDKSIVTCHHHMLKDTTIASGEWEGITGDYHGYMEDGAPEGSGYLYFVGAEPDANAFESYLADNPGAIDLWLGGHTHAAPGEIYGGKTHVERRWGVMFVNVSAMTKYHAGSVPMSRRLTFTSEGRYRMTAELECYLHTDDVAPIGWYEDSFHRLPLRLPYDPESRLTPAAPTRIG